MSEEIKKVINGEYNNPELDASMWNVLSTAIKDIRTSTCRTIYMCARELRSNVITPDLLNIITPDLLEDEYKHTDETTLGV